MTRVLLEDSSLRCSYLHSWCSLSSCLPLRNTAPRLLHPSALALHSSLAIWLAHASQEVRLLSFTQDLDSWWNLSLTHYSRHQSSPRFCSCCGQRQLPKLPLDLLDWPNPRLAFGSPRVQDHQGPRVRSLRRRWPRCRPPSRDKPILSRRRSGCSGGAKADSLSRIRRFYERDLKHGVEERTNPARSLGC